ncbi:hypothetical protein SDC9_168521 [bioreactor metagenome]|uniref:Uncharacterized protein n=1 Tax=bioreactor metagenome TaxID=1076179 RepID=A0A645G5A8_9ZZZZ
MRAVIVAVDGEQRVVFRCDCLNCIVYVFAVFATRKRRLEIVDRTDVDIGHVIRMRTVGNLFNRKAHIVAFI